MSLEQTTGILCIELLDRNYLEMLFGLGAPMILVDAYAGVGTSLMRCDVISMENIASTVALTNHLLSTGARRIGFVGDTNHCNSFYERWSGFCSALGSAGVAVDRSICILADDKAPRPGSDQGLSAVAGAGWMNVECSERQKMSEKTGADLKNLMIRASC